MINLNQWICSKDIAKWLKDHKQLSVTEQIDCICSAPHRTLQEKLDGLRRLNDDCEEIEHQRISESRYSRYQGSMAWTKRIFMELFMCYIK